MSFFKRLGKSVYGPEYYRQEVMVEPAKRAFGYYVKLILFLSLVAALGGAVTLGWPLARLGPGWLASLGELYPADLVITMADGRLTANGDERYVLPLTQVFGAGTTSWANDENESSPTNLIVFETGEATVDVGDLATADTLILVGHDRFIYQEGQGKTVIQTFSSWPDFTLDSTRVARWLSALAAWSGWAVPVVFLGFFLITFVFVGLSWLVFALLGALLIWLILFVRAWRVGYGRAYLITLHLLTLPLGLAILSLFILIPPFGWLSFLILAVAGLWNLRANPAKLDSSPTTTVSASS